MPVPKLKSKIRYWKRLAQMFRHYQGKSARLKYMPVRLWVELTSDCNYRCVMCPNKDLPGEERGHMDMDLFRKIIDEAAGFVFEINLAHRGESLLHPEFIEAVTYAKSKGIYTRLHTNGSLLTEDLARRTIESGLDRLSFSFDGYDKETYEKIRRGGKFEETAGNIIQYLKIKKELGSKTPETAVEVINFAAHTSKDNPEARRAFQDRFRSLPLDHYVMKELHNWAGEFHTGEKGVKYSICPFPWNALVICWDGAVIPCTQDFFNTYVAGNVREHSIREIWNGDRMKTIRKKLIEQDVDNLSACSKCDRPWRQRILGVPKEYLWKFLTKRMP